MIPSFKFSVAVNETAVLSQKARRQLNMIYSDYIRKQTNALTFCITVKLNAKHSAACIICTKIRLKTGQ